MSLSIQIDPVARDIVMGEHGPELVSDPSPELLLCVAVPLGSFPAEPEMGSRLPLLVAGGPAESDPGVLVAETRTAVQQVADAGLATIEDVRVEDGAVVVSVAELPDPLSFEV
jgi:hypothetical protein